MPWLVDAFLPSHPADVPIILCFMVEPTNKRGQNLDSFVPIFHGETVLCINLEDFPTFRLGMLLDLRALSVGYF
jgi:hypothetical protein